MLVPPSKQLYYKLENSASRIYYAQFYQDRIMNENYFKNKTRGFFLEVGAYDGEINSNTLFFEKSLNWTGILIESNPKKYGNLLKKKPPIMASARLP